MFLVTAPPLHPTHAAAASRTMDIQPSAQAQLKIFTRTPGPSLVSGRVIPGPPADVTRRNPNTKQWLKECVEVAAEDLDRQRAAAPISDAAVENDLGRL